MLLGAGVFQASLLGRSETHLGAYSTGARGVLLCTKVANLVDVFLSGLGVKNLPADSEVCSTSRFS